MQRVEGVEELFLRALLISNELDVVNKENVDLPETLAERVRCTLLNSKDELVREGFAGDVQNAALW